MWPFWYLNVSVWSLVRWHNLCLSGLCLNSVFAPYCKTENPHTPQAHPSASNFYEYHSDTPQTSPRQPRGISKEHKIPTDTNRHTHTPPDTPRHRQVLFEYVWQVATVPWHLLSSVGMSCSLQTSGGVWWMSGECLGDIWVVFMEIGGAQMCFGGMWVLSPYSIKRKHYLGTVVKGITFVTWPYWGIEISKWSHKSFPKMVGLCHFL